MRTVEIVIMYVSEYVPGSSLKTKQLCPLIFILYHLNNYTYYFQYGELIYLLKHCHLSTPKYDFEVF